MFVQLLPFPLTPPIAGAALKWRLNISNAMLGTQVRIAEIEMRDSVGGTDQCTGGTASASSDNSGANPASNAFDNNNSTTWLSDNGLPQTIEYDFASAVDVPQLTIKPSAITNCPNAFTVEKWDGAAWQVEWTEDEYYVSSSTAQLIFSRPDSGTAGALRWRIHVTAIQLSGVGGVCTISELQFRATSGGTDLTAAASADGGNPFDTEGEAGDSDNLFDNNTGTNASSTFEPSSGTPYNAGYRFPTQQTVTEVAIRCPVASNAPKTFSVQYLDPATGTWTTSWSVASSGTWTNGEQKVFTKP